MKCASRSVAVTLKASFEDHLVKTVTLDGQRCCLTGATGSHCVTHVTSFFSSFSFLDWYLVILLGLTTFIIHLRYMYTIQQIQYSIYYQTLTGTTATDDDLEWRERERKPSQSHLYSEVGYSRNLCVRLFSCV